MGAYFRFPVSLAQDSKGSIQRQRLPATSTRRPMKKSFSNMKRAAPTTATAFLADAPHCS
jgi:hypothetical protein